MPEIKFDWTINLSTVLTIVVLMIGGFGTAATMESNWSLVVSRIDSLEKAVTQISTIVVEQAKLGEWRYEVEHRLTNAEGRLDRLQLPSGR